jgi:uncharacterized protein YndB with AHSA1/START domain
MLTQAPPLRFTRTVDAPATEVYRAFSVPAALREWLCDAVQVDPRPGGRIYLWWNDGYYTAGIFTDLVRNERLVFTWNAPGEPPGTVTVALAAPDGATLVTVTHEPADGAGPAPDEAAITRRWEAALENLQSLLETGIDLRLARRPMFGLADGGELTAARAARLGVPVTEGIWIGGLLEGMAADAAGLQRDDVVVGLGDQPVTDFAGFTRAIQRHQAGDQVPVVFYRGPDRQTALLELSPRPAMAVPASVAALAAQARTVYQTVDAELGACLTPIPEAAMDYRPAPDEWNIKEVLAHLIAVERDVHTWVVTISEDGDLIEPFHNNVLQRVRGLTTAYPTVADLVTELHRAEAGTVAMIESLAPEVAARKHALRQLGVWYDALADHSREHFAEIRALAERAPA